MIKWFKYIKRRYRIKKVCRKTIKNLRMVCRGMSKERFSEHVKMMRLLQGYYKNNIHLIDVIPTKRGFLITINKDKLNETAR